MPLEEADEKLLVEAFNPCGRNCQRITVRRQYRGSIPRRAADQLEEGAWALIEGVWEDVLCMLPAGWLEEDGQATGTAFLARRDDDDRDDDDHTYDLFVRETHADEALGALRLRYLVRDEDAIGDDASDDASDHEASLLDDTEEAEEGQSAEPGNTEMISDCLEDAAGMIAMLTKSWYEDESPVGVPLTALEDKLTFMIGGGPTFQK